MQFKTLLLTMPLLCAACAGELFNEKNIDRLDVPAVQGYTQDQMDEAAAEMETYCDKVPMLCQIANDFGKMRDSARIALGLDVDINR